MNTVSVLDEVEMRLKEAAESLRASFSLYWPTWGKTGAHERNISLHVAHAFLRNGYAAFGESHSDGSAHSRFDVVAVTRNHVIACEFKQLWTPSKATGDKNSMEADFGRLSLFKPLKVLPDGIPVQDLPVIGVIAAFATEERFAVPFDKDGHRDGLVTPCDLTQQFCQKLPQSSRLGCVPLFAGKKPSLKEPAFVYAVFDAASVAA